MKRNKLLYHQGVTIKDLLIVLSAGLIPIGIVIIYKLLFGL